MVRDSNDACVSDDPVKLQLNEIDQMAIDELDLWMTKKLVESKAEKLNFFRNLLNPLKI